MSEHPPKPEAEKEQKPKVKFNPMVFIRPVIESIKSVSLGIKDVPKMVLKGDASQRFLVLGFVAGLTLLIISAQQIMKRWSPPSGPKKHVMTVEEEMLARFEKQEAYKRAEKSLAFLEKAKTTIQDKEGKETVMSVEFYAECDSPDTARWIRDNLDKMKEAVSSSIQGFKLEPLMTDEGKEDLKASVAEGLNKAYIKEHGGKKDAGKIVKVFISHLELSE